MDITRRSALMALASVCGAGMLPNSRALAATKLNTLTMPHLLADPMLGMVQERADIEINNGPWFSTGDTIAKLLAPGGTKADVYSGVTEMLAPTVLADDPANDLVVGSTLQQIPNIATIAPHLHNDIVRRGDLAYIIPVIWGYDTVIYNRKFIKDDDPAIGSYALMFDERFAGRISWQDQPYYMLYAAGLFLGHKIPHEATRQEIMEFADFLIKKKPLVRTLYQTASQNTELMANEEVIVSWAQIPTRVELERRGIDVASNWAKEGVIVWTQGYVIPTTSSVPDAARGMINGLLDADVGVLITRNTGYPTASQAAVSKLSDEEQKKYGFDIGSRDVKIVRYNFPKNLNVWTEAWTRVKGA